MLLLFEFTKEFVFKFMRFGVVGVSGTALDFGITYLSKEIFKTSKYIANALGFVIAASSNYYLNRIWTFHSSDSHVGMEFTRFFTVALIGLGINTLIIYYVNQKLGKNFYVAKVAATGVVLMWNFLANQFYTFATK